ADAGDRLQPGGVAGGDRQSELGMRHPREDDERRGRAEPLHLAKKMEEGTLALGEEADQLDRILAHLGMDEEPHGNARGREVGEGLQRDVDGIADAADVDHEPLGGLLGKRAGKRRDHLVVPSRASAVAMRRASRAAGAPRAPSAIVPLATWRSPTPRSSTTPQPVSRLPGSIPSTRNPSPPPVTPPTAAPAPPLRCPCSRTPTGRRRDPRAS